MQIILIARGLMNTHVLPEKIAGRHWITIVEKDGTSADLLCVEGIGGKWHLKSNRRAHVVNREKEMVAEQPLEAGKYYTVTIVEGDERVLIYTRPETADRKHFAKYILPDSGKIIIGRSSDADIVFDCPFASGNHSELTVSAHGISIEDMKSSNGTFVNGRKIQQAELKIGDVVSIVDFVIAIGNGFIALNNPDGKVQVRGSLKKLAIPKTQPVLDELEIEESTPNTMFYRSPRFRRAINPPKIKIDAPPTKEEKDETPLLLSVGPSVTMALMSIMMLMNMITSGRSGPSMYFMGIGMGAMAGGAILWPMLQRKHQTKRLKKKEKLRADEYIKYLDELEDEIDKYKIEQSEILQENYVPMHECIRRIDTLDRSLWERTEGNDDFLHLRLGIGDWPFEAEFQTPEKSFTLEKDSLQDEMFEVVDTPRILNHVPVGVSLTERFSLGLVGDRQETTDMMKSLIFQIAALHSYDEVKFIFIYNEAERTQWDFVRWLPHVWSDDFNMRFVASTPEEVRRLSAVIEQAIAQDKDETGATQAQRYVVFAFDRDLASKCDALNTVFRLNEYPNVSVVAVYDELRYLPKDCHMVLELDKEQSKLYDRSDTTGTHLGFAPDKPPVFNPHKLAVKLANVRLESAEEAFELPKMLTFLEMYEVGKAEHLNASHRWKENNPVKSLAVPVGVGVNGDLFDLDLHEKNHGPHGLVAGMTGSGKSEFIMTFILSLAVNFHPHEVAFVLIDYKGGGMANAFASLPHTVGVITNLDGASVNRSLASIQSELKRRQALFNEATTRCGVSNIDIYKYQGLYREGQISEPLPHLYIISDEFAELKTQQPEFMEQLVSAARIGRSLGVHLILATQKPSGVVDDQIWANSKFKVCLKVQDKSDSMEMIKRPDAAELVEVGRYYLQVGYNELFEMGQSAWAGASYMPSDRVERGYDASVVLLDDQGQPVAQVNPTPANQQVSKQKQLDAVTDYVIQVAEEEQVVNTPLWLEPLADRIYLPSLIQKYQVQQGGTFTIDVAMGEFDDPANQRQDLMRLNLSQDGNLLLFGMTGSGKTHFINSFIHSTLQDYTPEHINHYIIDFGSETLTAFAPAPHVGDVLLGSDEEKIENLFKMLDREMSKRKKLFVEYGGDFESYIEANEGTLPNIVVTINNWTAFAEVHEDAEDWISVLAREGVKYGIFFILTAATPNAVRYKLQANFKQQICLSFTDMDDYSAVFGRIGGLVPPQKPGRGLYQNEDGVFEFQSALISEELADNPRALRQACAQMADEDSGQSAKPVPSLPDIVTNDALRICANDVEKRCVGTGVSRETLEIIPYDFSKQKMTFVMARDDNCYRFTRTLMNICAEQMPGSVALVDEVGILDRDGGVSGATMLTSEQLIEGVKLDDSVRFICLVNLPAIYEGIEYAARELFIEKLKELSENSNRSFISVCTNDEFSSIAYESWMSDFTSLENGLWIGDGFGDQYHLKAQGSFYQDIGDNFGIVVDKGSGTIAKMLEA